MRINKIILGLMRALHVSQQTMADRTGRKSQTQISTILCRDNLTIETIIPMLEAIDCELIVRKRGTEVEIPVTLDDTQERHIVVIG